MLARASEVHIQADKTGIAEDAVPAVIPGANIYIPFADLVDADKELERLSKEEERLNGEIRRSNGMLKNEKFLAKVARDPEVRATGSGLMYKVLKEGTGKKPTATSQVKCHYEGTFADGQVFDSSYKRGEPAVFGLNQVIKGWTEGLQLMAEGAKYELYLPYNLAYGEHGAGNAIPPYCALKFVVELIEVL